MSPVAYDFDATFGKDSAGRTHERIMLHSGKMALDEICWKAGDVAYQVLRQAYPDGVTAAEFSAWLGEAQLFLRDEFGADFAAAIVKGKIGVNFKGFDHDMEPSDFPALWANYGISQQFEIFLNFIEETDPAWIIDPQMKSWVGMMTATVLLDALDNAVMAEFNDGNGLPEILHDIFNLKNRLDVPSYVSRALDLTAKNAISKQGKAGATAKLAADPKQAAKAEVFECWKLWQQDARRYKGPTAFVRDMREKFENLDSEEVIRRWCREWKAATQQAE